MKKVLCIEEYGRCKVGEWYRVDHGGLWPVEVTVIIPPYGSVVHCSMRVPGSYFISEEEARDAKLVTILDTSKN